MAQRLGQQLLGSFGRTGGHGGVSEALQGEGEPSWVACLPAQGDGLSGGGCRLGQVALDHGEPGGGRQRLRMGRRRDRAGQGQHTDDLRPALGVVPVHLPPRVQRAGQPHGCLGVLVAGRVRKGGLDVVVFGGEFLPPTGLFGAAHQRMAGFDHGQEVCSVSGLEPVGLAPFAEDKQSVGPQGLQQAVATRAPAVDRRGVAGHERLVHQLDQHVGYGAVMVVGFAADRLGGLQRESADEHARRSNSRRCGSSSIS